MWYAPGVTSQGKIARLRGESPHSPTRASLRSSLLAETPLGGGSSWSQADHCAICGQPVGDSKYEWEGPTPVGGKPETGVLCVPCGESEEAGRVKSEQYQQELDSALGK